ncbi:hypothetical protein [Streptomyces tagetis]|uniref:Uncharacterized protein n=1 Tax=Streptomyces tagetis TaxID=2820809 RepID=A0A940XWI3_9ACTN|nr:hypothetical protein [Streptomyces sp. RG38]MBQ0830828.1 hypothetical protein [Streptomyces sp. RG38]
MLTPLASAAALAVGLCDLIEAADHGAGELVDAELTRPDRGSLVVVIAAIARFQHAAPDVLAFAVEDPPAAFAW